MTTQQLPPFGLLRAASAELQQFLRRPQLFRIYLDTTCQPDWHEVWRKTPDEYGVQGALPSLLSQSEFFTSDWRQADAILVAPLISSRWGTPAVTQQQCFQRQRHRSEAYRASNGSRHFFLLATPRGPCCVNGLYKDISFMRHHILHHQPLLDSARNHDSGLKDGEKNPMAIPCFDARKDLSIAGFAPSPPPADPANVSSTLISLPPEQRPYIVFFFRSRCHNTKVASDQEKRVLVAHDTKKVSVEAWRKVEVRGMHLARYCAVCPSERPDVLGIPPLFEMLRAGCVPVFLYVPERKLPRAWHNLIDYSLFSVDMDITELPRLTSIVESLDTAALQQAGRRIRWAFDYSKRDSRGSPHGTMLSLLAFQMAQLLRNPIPPPLVSHRAVSNNIRTWGKHKRYSAVSKIEVHGNDWRCYTYGKTCTCWDHERRRFENEELKAAKKEQQRLERVKRYFQKADKVDSERKKKNWMSQLALQLARKVWWQRCRDQQRAKQGWLGPNTTKQMKVNGTYSDRLAALAAQVDRVCTSAKLTKLCMLCPVQFCTNKARADGRWLIAYAHASNGVGNRLAGLRASAHMAEATGRQLVIRWFGKEDGGQESRYLQPGQKWRWSTHEKLLPFERTPDSNVSDKPTWSRWLSKTCQTSRQLHAGKSIWPESFTCADTTRPCSGIPLLDELTVSGTTGENVDTRAFDAFWQLSASAAPIVIVDSQSRDLYNRGVPQAHLAHMAHAYYEQLFQPTATFYRAACKHLERLGLHQGDTWVGLQLRRTPVFERDLETVRSPGRGLNVSDLRGYDTRLTKKDEQGVREAVDCARRMQIAICEEASPGRACKVPIFITSSSIGVLRLAASLIGDEDARWTRDELFTFHVGPKVGYLSALLELATLSAATAIIGTAGSSFVTEAANLANTTAVLKSFNNLYATVGVDEVASQGECDIPPPRGRSVLLPPNVCHHDQGLGRS